MESSARPQWTTFCSPESWPWMALETSRNPGCHWVLGIEKVCSGWGSIVLEGSHDLCFQEFSQAPRLLSNSTQFYHHRTLQCQNWACHWSLRKRVTVRCTLTDQCFVTHKDWELALVWRKHSLLSRNDHGSLAHHGTVLLCEWESTGKGNWHKNVGQLWKSLLFVLNLG